MNVTICTVDSSRDDHEPTTAAFERDVVPPSEVPLSMGVVEGVPLLEAGVGIGGSPVEACGTVQRVEPSSLRPVNIPTTSTHERGEGVSEGGYKMGSNLDS